MVYFASFIGAAAILSGVVNARPMPQDSSINEPAVSAPNGTPITEQILSTEVANVANAPAVQTTSASSAPAEAVTSAAGGYAQNWGQSSYTQSAANTYATPAYGSGNTNYGGGYNAGYDDCVQQCVASYGASAAVYKPTATAGSAGSSGTGATHTVIVAPTQGVLRYVPFAVNASVGDTIKFMWGANNHTVTKSSALQLCNKSSDALFASGLNNKDFVFTQVVNDTNPTYFHCAAPTHCTKGMFGVINPPSLAGAPTSIGKAMTGMAANNSDIAAMWSYTVKQTAGNQKAAGWGSNIDMASMPEWSHKYIAENTMYTRTFLAANPEVIGENGAIDMSAAGSNPIMIPQDLSAVINNAASTASSTGASADASPSAASDAEASPSPVAAAANGASSMASPSMLVGVMAVAVAFFAL